ncbi:MAG: corrinoid protein-associated methyltransferase CpaM [Myxococcota bacterium]
MSSLALMKFLESAPRRYDTGMKILTLGRVDRVRDALAAAAAPGTSGRVLEIGCGTGAVTARLLARGAEVTALDQNPEMLAQARLRLVETPAGKLTLLERTASEIDALPEASFDAVVASFSLSEMSAAERRFVLGAAVRCLRPGGVVAIADEVRPRAMWRRALYTALRAPQAVLAWLLVGSTSHPVPDAAAELRAAGLIVREERRWLLESLSLVVAERPQ